ncbi:MAG: UDP-N-acetylmuramate--L-alanine ligase [Bacteroidales bacterium]|nr:UDP-N-acetylmuramate--L-alanine ligase [Bacteroidales bacterium]
MRYYFLGIGGIGMSALARFFKQRGDEVSGYDRTESPLTQQLVKEGIDVHYEDNPQLIPQGIDMVIYTPAVPKDTAEFVHLEKSGITMMKRSQMLGELTKGKKCVAVAGSHGKTTTSSMIAYLLHQSHIGCSAFLGGIAKNFNSNMVVDLKSDYVVVEADEYDRSFLQLHPLYSVITATDPDHLDIYGTHENLLAAFRQYAKQTQPEGHLFVKEGNLGVGHSHEEEEHDHHEHHHDEDHTDLAPCPVSSYTAHGMEADYYAINVRNSRGSIFFDLRTPYGVIYDLELNNSTLYNVENSVAAIAVVMQCGITEEELRRGLKTFSGIKRRFDYHVNTPEIVYIDDYAHHPQEIAATIESIKYLYPNKRVVGIFQPHLYSRTQDLADGFAEALSPLDEIILMPIYPARETPIPGVTSKLILNKINKLSKYLCTPEQVLELIPALYPDVLVTMGAGDIDRLVPKIEELLRNN